MKKLNFVLLFVLFLVVNNINAQIPSYSCDIRNQNRVTDNIFEFDLFVSGGNTSFELANYQASILINSNLLSSGIVEASLVSGHSNLVDGQQPSSISFDNVAGCLMIAPKAPPRIVNSITGTSTTSGTLIPSNNDVRICRIRLTSTSSFGTGGMLPVWNFDVNPYNTVVSAFIGDPEHRVNTIITNQMNHSRSIELKAYLEGAYDQGSGEMSLNITPFIPVNQPYVDEPWNYNGSEDVSEIPEEVVDWVLVQLRDAPSASEAIPSTTRQTRACFIGKDGKIISTDGYSNLEMSFIPEHNVYGVIRHRNHLGVIGSAPLIVNGSTYSYDFSSSISQVLGESAGYKELATGVFVLVAGDADPDGQVLATDYNEWSMDLGNTGVYSSTDMDMDGQVLATDYNLWSINLGVSNPVSGVQEPVLKYSSQLPDYK